MRLFIALNFDEETKDKLLSVQKQLQKYAPGNFTRRENLHLTVLFLGETESWRPVAQSMKARFITPVRLSFYRTGQFRGNIFWVGLRPEPALQTLYKDLLRDLKQAGYPLEERGEYRPHITLGREVVLPKGVLPRLPFEEFFMTARHLSLMKSERINGRLVYTELFGKSISGSAAHGDSR